MIDSPDVAASSQGRAPRTSSATAAERYPSVHGARTSAKSPMVPATQDLERLDHPAPYQVTRVFGEDP